ncbi:hypothetical protein ACU4GD_29790 [Cupriavidus basilensis]
MSWPLNLPLARKRAIMWTLFWAGRTLTPEFCIQGQNVQDYLQGHFFDAVEQMALRLRAAAARDRLRHSQRTGTRLAGPIVSDARRPASARSCRHAARRAFAGPGHPDRGPLIPSSSDQRGPRSDAMRLLNAPGRSIWVDGASCPFEHAGIYRLERGRIVPLDEDVFKRVERSPSGHR